MRSTVCADNGIGGAGKAPNALTGRGPAPLLELGPAPLIR